MDPAVSLQSQQVLAWIGFVLPHLAGFVLYLQPFCIKLHDHMLKYTFTHLLYIWEQNNQALGRKHLLRHFGCTSKCKSSSLLKNLTTESSTTGDLVCCPALLQKQPSSGKDLRYPMETNIIAPESKKHV